MKKLLFVILPLFLISGCSWFSKENIVVRTQKVNVPVFVCPGKLKDLQTPDQPEYLIFNLTEEDKQNHGKVGQAYKGSMKQALDHIEVLESIIGDISLVCENPEIE